MAAPWLIYAAIAAVSAGVSYVTAKSAQKKAKQAAKANEGLLINSEGANNHIPVIYGARRIAGTRVFVETGPGPRGANDYLYMILVLCEGEVQSITDFLIDDAPTSDPRFAYGDSIAINTYVGTDAQTVDPMFDAAGIGWDTGYDLKGLCYIAVRLKWNPDAFSSIPNITALVTGKKVYDPRTATTVHSTNPALCIRDYLTNARYGKGLDSSLIDDTAIIAAANFYDTTVTYWTSGTVGKLFEFNMVLDTEQDILENIKDMLMCCRGFLPYTNGLYQLLPDKSSSSVFAFTTDEIIGGLSIKGESKDEKYNRVNCTFIDPENNWQENTAIWPDSGSAEETAYLAEDGGVELVGDFDLPCITNYYAARDIARIFLARSRNALRASFVATSEALNLSVGDVVTVTHPTPGWAAKPFQVEEITINYDGTVGVSLLEYDSSIYTYDPASEQVAYADTNLPNPFTVAAPTSFVVTETTYLASDGTVIPEISVAWTAAADAFVAYYEFQFKIDTDSVWNSVVTYETVYVSSFATVGETYDIRARSVNSLGVRSDWLTSTYTVTGDTSAPATPTGLTITGDYNQAVLKWNAASEKDYKETLIYASTTNNSATATLEARISGNTVTVAGLPVSTTYYVWLKNEDYSGNISGFSTVVSFSTTAGAAAISVVAGGTIAGTVTTDAVQISTIRTNAASGKSISDTLLVSGTATLKGVIQPDTTGAIRTGTITWNATTGALTGGTGIAITQWGIIGAASGAETFSVEAATGSAKFAGNVLTGGYMYAQGGYNDGTYTGAIYAQPSSSSQRGVIGRSTGTGVGTTGRTSTGIGVQGIADSTSGIAVQAVGGGASGVALNVIDGYITRAFSTTGRLTVYDQNSPYAALGTYLYAFHV
jgi:hypothetical protein